MTPNYSRKTVEETDAYRAPFEPYEEVDTSPPRVRFAENVNPHHVAARGFAQMFGLVPGIALLLVIVDLMLHGAAVMTAGLLIPFSFLGGIVLGYVTYKLQKALYGDDDEIAKAKAIIVALVTIIPSPLPYALFIPAGIVGWLRRKP